MTNKLTFLKNSLLGILLMTLFSFSASAQQWDTVGVAGFSDSTVFSQSLDVYNDTTYVAYRDASNQNKLRVQMYDGSSWVDVGGPSISAGTASNIDLLVVSSNRIYVAYVDGANGDGLTVMRYNGTSWVMDATTIAYNSSFGAIGGGDPSLAYSTANNSLYLAYKENDFNAQFVYITVQRLIGNSWSSLGSIASGNATGPGVIGAPRLKFAPNGTLYITYPNSDIKVKRYTGTSWISVGGTNSISSGLGDQADLEIGSNGDLYVAFRDGDNSNKTTVAKYTNSSWGVLGTVGFTNGVSNYQDLALNNNDKPYVSQVEGSSNVDITVYGFNGTNWTDVGTGTAIAYGGSPFSLAAALEIDNSTAYLSLINVNNKLTVMKYDLTVGINQIPTLNKEITIYPNPTKEQLTIEGVEQIELIRILTMDGKVMQTITTNSNTISVEALPQGVYMIEVITSEGIGYKNFVKQ